LADLLYNEYASSRTEAKEPITDIGFRPDLMGDLYTG